MNENLLKIMQLNVEKRYQYLLQEIAKHNAIWILVDDDGCVMLRSDDEDCVPIWPSREFAEYWATLDWSNCKALEVSVNDWKKKWTDGLIADDIQIAIFPNPDEAGLVIFPDEFEQDVKKSS